MYIYFLNSHNAMHVTSPTLNGHWKEKIICAIDMFSIIYGQFFWISWTNGQFFWIAWTNGNFFWISWTMLGVDGWVWNKSLVVNAVHFHLLVLLKAAAAGSPGKGQGVKL